jgi:hypothetical protein
LELSHISAKKIEHSPLTAHSNISSSNNIPENLYIECRNEHIPFHKYQKWIEKKVFKKEKIEIPKNYEDFKTITGIFCSSLIVLE